MSAPLAFLALFLFPVVSLFAFSRMDAAKAVAFTVLGGSLFLPEVVAIDIPIIPPLEKENITYLSVLLAVVVHQRSRFFSTSKALPYAILFAAFLANVATMAMNSEPMMDEGKLEDGLGLWWLMTNTGEIYLATVVPFIIGRAMINSHEDLVVLLRGIVIVGLVYTVLIVIEVLLSIPFRVWQFSQVVYDIPMRPMWRWGVIQPILLMDNGLALATFMALAVIASAALLKARIEVPKLGPVSPKISTLFGLLMTRNVAGNFYGWVYMLIFAVLKPKLIARCALLTALIACTYPMLRMVDMFPNDALVAFAARYDADRARSLEGRFLEEDFVRSNIGDRVYFGWGNIMRTPGAETFGRGEPGLDSWWVITFGSKGMVGVAVTLILFAVPVLVAWRRVKSHAIEEAEIILLAALMAMVAIRMIDLLINGWWNNLPMFLAGALLGASARERVAVPGWRRAWS